MVFRSWWRNRARLLIAAGCLLPAGCRTPSAPRSTAPAGTEIIVAGKGFPAGTRVVTWLEPGGFNAYATRKPLYGRRPSAKGKKDRDPTVRELQRQVDQFVLHYDGGGLSRICFDVLQKRGLSVHFLLDVDGTIYQTLDLQERAWHAGTANDRSIGVEIANLGAYPPAEAKVLAEWYQRGPAGQTRLVPPKAAGDGRVRTPNFQGRPQRPDPVRGKVNGRELVQYDFTPEQYAALIKLTAALHRIFPQIALDYPRDAQGRLVTGQLTDKQLAAFRGVLGHFHVSASKYDPGPAFQWEAVIMRARREPSSARTSDRP